MFDFLKKPEISSVTDAIVDLSEDAIIAIDGAHKIILFNGGGARIFGYKKDEVIGKPLDMLLPTQFRHNHNRLIDEFGLSEQKTRRMGERSNQVMGLRKDGSEFPVSVTILNIGTRDKPIYGAILRDVTEHKKTEDELMRLAATDPLTGALNRREFLALSSRESLRARRYGRPLSVLMLDLDHFKQLNDNYGHAAGDKALQRFTSLCCNALRNIDIFARWGGEEFVALLPETDIDGAAIMGERLRQVVGQESFELRGQSFGLTVSVGVSTYRDEETDIDGPLSRADAAVYDAKRAGRNRVAVYHDEK